VEAGGEAVGNAIKLIIIHDAVASILHRTDCLIPSLPLLYLAYVPICTKEKYATATPWITYQMLLAHQ